MLSNRQGDALKTENRTSMPPTIDFRDEVSIHVRSKSDDIEIADFVRSVDFKRLVQIMLGSFIVLLLLLNVSTSSEPSIPAKPYSDHSAPLSQEPTAPEPEDVNSADLEVALPEYVEPLYDDEEEDHTPHAALPTNVNDDEQYNTDPLDVDSDASLRSRIVSEPGSEGDEDNVKLKKADREPEQHHTSRYSYEEEREVEPSESVLPEETVKESKEPPYSATEYIFPEIYDEVVIESSSPSGFYDDRVDSNTDVEVEVEGEEDNTNDDEDEDITDVEVEGDNEDEEDGGGELPEPKMFIHPSDRVPLEDGFAPPK